jgi:dienelactone hydrolase
VKAFGSLTALALGLATAQASPDPCLAELQSLWSKEVFEETPASFPAEGYVSSDNRIQGIFLEGPNYEGRTTRIFAWVGLPSVPAQEKSPAIILVHGGQGTAYEWWVKDWLDRGYAAIAVDVFGRTPGLAGAGPARHPRGGPMGGGGFARALLEPSEQWPYHGVDAILRANSFLRSLDRVHPDRIGVTGISWGGFLTCLAAALDDRFAFAVPVYGSGFIDQTVFGDQLANLGADYKSRWLSLWDPARYLPHSRVPMLWVTGTNDRFFWLPAWQKSHQLIPKENRVIALLPGLPHGHHAGARLAEIYHFADSQVGRGSTLLSLGGKSQSAEGFLLEFKGGSTVKEAFLYFTTDSGKPWPERDWQKVPVKFSANTVRVKPPEGLQWFVRIIDHRGLSTTSEVYHYTDNKIDP